MFDCHVHTSFSTDSKADAITICERAIELGLEGIAFTDHLDYEFPDFYEEFHIDFDVYSQYMDSLKKKYESRLKVLKGLEIGIQPSVIEKSSEIVKKYDFDFIIGSIHIIDGENPYSGVYYDNKTKEETYSLYLKKILFLIREFDDFDVTGHFGYIIRNAPYDDRTLLYSDHKDLFDLIFKELISKGKGFEINTASYRVRTAIDRTAKMPEYDINILKRYKELGGEIITLGSDAHSAKSIGYMFEYFRDILINSGFKYIAHYEKRKPVFNKL